MNNYRVEYGRKFEQNFDYYNKSDKLQPEACNRFRDLPGKLWPEISKIYERADELGIKYIWHFYEPYVEITWLSDSTEVSEQLISFIETLVSHYGDLVIRRPADGIFADWYCTTPREMEFGAKRHALCAQWVRLYNEYKDCVDNGKGLQNQVARTIHTLANPLGLNYWDEAKICWRRFVMGTLLRYMSFEKAGFVFYKILRFKK